MLNKILIIPSHFRTVQKDYRAPLIATGFFFALVFALLGLRLHEHSLASQLVSENSSSGHDYATLLNRDKVDKFDGSEVDTTEVPDTSASQKSAANSSTTFKSGAAATSSRTQSSTPATGSSNSDTGSSTPTAPSSTPAAPFSAAISNFREEKDPTLQCVNGSGSKSSNCSKTYYVAGDVTTQNGSGKVSYNWIYTVSGSTNGSYTAASGTATVTINANG
jgi:hypothetical protein